MNEKEDIEKLINTYPKHFSKMVQNREHLWSWVIKNTLLESGTPPALIYSAIKQESDQCINNRTKSFNSIHTGFRFCGPANKCECAKESVSKKVSETKSARTVEQIEIENRKRELTNLEKYGVSNSGQTTFARTQHANVYASVDRVNDITKKIKNTKIKNHGNANYNNREQCAITNIAKYGVPNTWSLSDAKQNPNLILLKNKNWLEQTFSTQTVDDIANNLGVHKQTVYYYLGLHGLREPYKSTFEQEIESFLRHNGITNIVRNNRKLIGKEIDIYLPDYKLAIEYNGEYWHHIDVPHISKTYHYDKFISCENLGITLFTIFGNSWKNNKDVWKKKILNKLGLTHKRIFARKTRIVDLTKKQTYLFLNDNHIQGDCTAQYRYGLMYDDDLVATMTFSKTRSGIGKYRGDGVYELVRYATSCSVVGGASKLLKHFINTHSPRQVISYSDNQYSVGDMYNKLGFELENETKNGYWYYDPVNKKTYHRYRFTKHKLVEEGYDKDKTEREIMSGRGFLRIYDCGSRTWILTLFGHD